MRRDDVHRGLTTWRWSPHQSPAVSYQFISKSWNSFCGPGNRGSWLSISRRSRNWCRKACYWGLVSNPRLPGHTTNKLSQCFIVVFSWNKWADLTGWALWRLQDGVNKTALRGSTAGLSHSNEHCVGQYKNNSLTRRKQDVWCVFLVFPSKQVS